MTGYSDSIVLRPRTVPTEPVIKSIGRVPGMLGGIKGLLIDIDDTIVRAKGGKKFNAGSLFDVLQRAAVELAELTPQEAEARIRRIKEETRWWHWSDFIVGLELNPKTFWEYAYEMERHYIEPTGPEIGPALQRLHNAGLRLYVTSNNPSSGILHKLRLAGVAHINGSTLFDQLLGATELHAMKWEPMYWKKALAHIGMDASELAVVGDDLEDDFEVPRAAGIACSFILDRQKDPAAQCSDRLIYVRDFDQLADFLIPRDS